MDLSSPVGSFALEDFHSFVGFFDRCWADISKPLSLSPLPAWQKAHCSFDCYPLPFSTFVLEGFPKALLCLPSVSIERLFCSFWFYERLRWIIPQHQQSQLVVYLFSRSPEYAEPHTSLQTLEGASLPLLPSLDTSYCFLLSPCRKEPALHRADFVEKLLGNSRTLYKSAIPYSYLEGFGQPGDETALQKHNPDFLLYLMGCYLLIWLVVSASLTSTEMTFTGVGSVYCFSQALLRLGGTSAVHGRYRGQFKQ